MLHSLNFAKSKSLNYLFTFPEKLYVATLTQNHIFWFKTNPRSQLRKNQYSFKVEKKTTHVKSIKTPTHK